MSSIIENRDLLILPSNLPERSLYRLQKAVKHWRSFSDSIPAEEKSSIEPAHLKWIFINTLMHLYRSLPSLNFLKNKQISICTQVEEDGLGDYYHALTDIEIIKSCYPESLITCLFDFAKYEEHKETLFHPKDSELIFFNSKDPTISLEKLQTIVQRINNSSLIIDAPVGEFELFNPNFSRNNLLKYKEILSKCVVSSDKILAFREYDGTSRFDDPDRWVLGTSPFRMGIFFKSPPKGTTLADLSEVPLKSFLFQTPEPTPELIAKYEKNHQLYYGYIKIDHPDDLFSIAHLLMVAAANAKSKETIDLILPMNDLQIESKPYLLELFKYLGVRTISLFKKEKEEMVLKKELRIAEKGTTLRIINSFPMKNEDCKILAFLSKNPVGCTGDISLTEIISFLKIYVYQAADHKGSIQPSLLKVLVEELTEGKETALVKYLECLSKIGQILTDFSDDESEPLSEEEDGEESSASEPERKKMRINEDKQEIPSAIVQVGTQSEDEKICRLAIEAGHLLRDPYIDEEMKAFSNLLKKRYCFNELLIDLIDRHFAQMQSPSLKEKENLLLDAFLSKKISLVQVQDQLKTEIDSLSIRPLV